MEPATTLAADVFATEPELLSACLEAGADNPAWTRRVFAQARQALTRRPHYADLCYHAAQTALAAGDLARAAALLDDALRINPQYLDALILAARVGLRRHAPAQARSRLQAALRCGADFPDVHLLIGDAWRQERNWKQARRAYQRALELNAHLTAARNALALLPPAAGVGCRDELPT